jgi:hypothetical protein
MFCHDVQKPRLRMHGFQYGYSQYINIAYSILSRAVGKTTRILVLRVRDIAPYNKNSLVDPILLSLKKNEVTRRKHF